MATITKRPIPLNGIRMRNGGFPTIRVHTEVDSSTFKYGDLVYLNASGSGGTLTVCGADPSAIYGIALADATNVTTGNADIPVLVLTNDVEVAMNVYHATAASATFTYPTGLSTAYEIVQSSAGIWCIDIAATSNTRVHVHEYLDNAGDLYMRCWVQFMAATLQFETV